MSVAKCQLEYDCTYPIMKTLRENKNKRYEEKRNREEEEKREAVEKRRRVSDRRQNVGEQKPNLQTAGRISAESIASSAPENYAQKSIFLQT